MYKYIHVYHISCQADGRHGTLFDLLPLKRARPLHVEQNERGDSFKLIGYNNKDVARVARLPLENTQLNKRGIFACMKVHR